MTEKKKNLLFTIPAALLLMLAIWQMFFVFGAPFSLQAEETEEETAGDAEGNLLSPGNLYVTLGGQEEGRYARITPEEKSFSTLFYACMDLTTRLAEGEAWEEASKEELPWDKPAVILEYPAGLSANSFFAELETEDSRKAQEIAVEMWVLPSLKEGENASVYLIFVNGAVLSLTGGEREWAENLTLYQEVLLEGSTRTKTYLHTGRIYGESFDHGGLVLSAQERDTVVQGRVESYFSLERGEEEAKNRMRSFALGFFEYPDTVTVRETTDGLLFLNEKISLRLSYGGAMEYVETLTDAEKQETTMKEAYRTALSFLEADLSRQSGAKPAAILRRCEAGKNEYVFSFSYWIGDKELILGEEDSCRITVRGSKVLRCERQVAELWVTDARNLWNSWLTITDGASDKELLAAPRVVYRVTQGTLVPWWLLETPEGIRYELGI